MLNDPSEMLNDLSEMLNDLPEMLNDLSEMLNHPSGMLNDLSEMLNDFSEMLNDPSRMLNDLPEMLNDPSGMLNDPSGMLWSAVTTGGRLKCRREGIAGSGREANRLAVRASGDLKSALGRGDHEDRNSRSLDCGAKCAFRRLRTPPAEGWR
jgi:hypothetical protein